jgi:hypothetical protein
MAFLIKNGQKISRLFGAHINNLTTLLNDTVIIKNTLLKIKLSKKIIYTRGYAQG